MWTNVDGNFLSTSYFYYTKSPLFCKCFFAAPGMAVSSFALGNASALGMFFVRVLMQIVPDVKQLYTLI